MIIGITGGLATGTSTAARYIASDFNAVVISADKIAHSQLKSNKPFMKKLVLRFGKDIIGKQGSIDRKRLAEKAFSNKSKHKKLCQIAYPIIIADISDRIKKLYRQNLKNIVIDGAMLIESGFYKKCDFIIVVTASLPLQVQRCVEKKILAKNALFRIRFQMPLYKKVKYADYIIDNGGNLRELYDRCKEIIENIKNGK
ncbi:MAG: dephospho-CoA kinase [Dehalococcoidia bacterium]|nr:MAG: dephospho-CoA kinase [Dehalococcoidia bacterium]